MADPNSGPTDTFKLVFFIFMLHGLGTLMPWNMFITAKSYFEDYKFSVNYTGPTDIDYRGNFMQNMGLASQIPNVCFNWLNIFIHFGGDLTLRIVYSILCELLVLALTVVLAFLDSSDVSRKNNQISPEFNFTFLFKVARHVLLDYNVLHCIYKYGMYTN